MTAPLVRRWGELRSRIRSLRDRGQLDEDLREEMETHLELRRERLIADGWPPEDAAREARLRFGNPAVIAENAADARGLPGVESFLRDLGFGWRMLRRAPSFAAVAVASLGVAIGGAVGVFAIADALVLRRLAVPDPDSLIVLRWQSGSRAPFAGLDGWAAQDAAGLSSTSFSTDAFDGMRRAAANRAEVFGFANLYSVNALVDGAAERVGAQVVSGNYATALRLRPALGRLLDERDDRLDASPAVVLSHAYWRRRFAADPSALGRGITVNGVTYTVVGVAPRGFHGTLQVEDRPELTFPLAHYASLTGQEVDRASYWHVLLMARLRPDTTAADLRPALEIVLAQTTAASRPELAAADLPRLSVSDGSRGQHESRDTTREELVAMAAIVALLLLVACANVASLQLARGSARRHEIATRLALGASRGRLVRQLLTEGLVLASCGGALGFALAWLLGSALLPALVGGGEIAVDLAYGGRTLAFTLLLVSACTLAFALTPALRLTDRRERALELASNRATHRPRLAAALVVAQVALSLALLSAGTLLITSARRLAAVDPGFDTARLLLADVEPSTRVEPPDDAVRRYRLVRDRLAALPEVESVTLTSHRLLAGSSAITFSTPPGVRSPPPGSSEEAGFQRSHRTRVLAVADGFFETFGVPIVGGRALDPADDTGAPNVAVVNRRLARQLFDREDVVGRQVLVGDDATLYTIVGVAADAHYTSMREEPPATLYASLWQSSPRRVTLAVKTRRDPLASADAVRQAVREIDPTLVLSNLGTQADQARRSIGQELVFARLATALGVATLLLSASGLFGLLAYSVARRSREIGIRMAVGARRRAVAWLVVRQSLQLVGGGLLIGLPAAITVGRLVESLLYGAEPVKPAAVVFAAALMLAVGLLAALLPARRAAGVDPLVALRIE